MRDYSELFTQIVRAVRRDYAGYPDKRNSDQAAIYSNMLQQAFRRGRLDDAAFSLILRQYLAEFRDRNLRLLWLQAPEEYCGFRARRFGDSLYVTEALPETGLAPGERIVKVNRRDIGAFSGSPSNGLYGQCPERELWEDFLERAERCTVESHGSLREIMPRKYPLQASPRNTYQKIDEDTACLRLESFMDIEATEALIMAQMDEMRACRRLILDLRNNEGGYDSAYFPLLPLLFQGVSIAELLKDKRMERNYSEANCDLRIAQYQQFSDPGMQPLIDGLRAKRGKGFIEEAEDTEGLEAPLPVGPQPERVILLSDIYCRNAGEEFLALAAASPRVTTMGRASMGRLPYGDIIVRALDEAFALSYPMARTAAPPGGVPVDIPIPWTPEHIFTDLDRKKAMEI